MNDKQLSGKWTGTYTYGDEYDESVRGKSVDFELNISIVNGVIKGECFDAEASGHFEKPAIIEGTMVNNTINFVKRYPYYWQHEKGGQRFLPKLPSQEINYSGRFENDRFEGEWEIITTLIDAQGELISYKGVGRWFMKKEM
jgi:hypothetical protein